MKKAFALLLAVLMLMSLAACSGGTSSGSTPAASGSAAPASSSAGNGETVKVVITLPSMNNLPSEEAKQAVSDALSESVSYTHLDEIRCATSSMVVFRYF